MHIRFYIYFSLISAWKYKILYFLIFTLSVFHEYSYQNIFQRFSTFRDLHISLVTTSEQKLNGIIIYFGYLALVPAIIYLFTLLFVKSNAPKHGLKSLLLIILCFIGFYSHNYQNLRLNKVYNFPTVSINAFSRTSVSYFFFKLSDFGENRISPEKPNLADLYRPNNNIVLIVDESIRGDSLSLNGYHKKTTPFLDSLQEKGLIKNWGIAASASTCSIHSHDILLTGLKTDDFPDKANNISKVPLIFQYAKAMQYKSYYLDGQMDSFWGALEYTGNKYIDNRIDINTFYKTGVEYSDTDFELAKKINEIISSSSGNFIFVFKKGVHLPYNLAFPETETVWKPSFVGNTPYRLPLEELESLVNSYDNGIRYNSDNFFKNLASDYSNLPNNTIIIYTGDHGQTLGQGGEYYPHCGDSKNEAMVPLFMLGKLDKEVDVKFKASHENIFATILDLMNYPEDLRKQNYAISLLKAKEADSKQRYYVPANSNLNLSESAKIKFE